MTKSVLTNASIVTCDALGTVASAIAIDRGRILCVGDEDAVRAEAGPEPRVIDLLGATVIPGAHRYPPSPDALRGACRATGGPCRRPFPRGHLAAHRPARQQPSAGGVGDGQAG